MIGSMLFLARECWLNLRRQGLMVLACVSTAGIALSILGVFILLALQLFVIAEAAPRQFEIHAFMKGGAPRSEAQARLKEIKELPGVATVRLIPREQAWKEFRRQSVHGAELDGFNENPLPDKLEIVAANPKQSLRISQEVRAMPQVAEVKDGKEVLLRLLSILDVVRLVGLGLSVLLGLGAAAIIGNAIRMTLFARRRDIRVMQLVGATNGLIRLPFLLEGMVQGTLGGAVACAVVLGVLHYYTRRILPQLSLGAQFSLPVDLPVFCAAIVIGGALIGMFGSLVSIRKFLHAA
jgi:cell division transport system permease protein